MSAVSSEEREFVVGWRIHETPWQSGIQLRFDGLAGAGPVQRAGSVQLAGGMASTKAWCGGARSGCKKLQDSIQDPELHS